MYQLNHTSLPSHLFVCLSAESVWENLMYAEAKSPDNACVENLRHLARTIEVKICRVLVITCHYYRDR